MRSPLENLSGPGKALDVEPPDGAEFAGLMRAGLARLQDAENTTLSLDGRFLLAYNAAHALCLAAVRRCGYRPKHRYIVFQVLPHTLGIGPEVWRVLAKAHDLRNLAEYQGEMEIDDRIVADLLTACRAVADRLAKLPAL